MADGAKFSLITSLLKGVLERQACLGKARELSLAVAAGTSRAKFAGKILSNGKVFELFALRQRFRNPLRLTPLTSPSLLGIFGVDIPWRVLCRF